MRKLLSNIFILAGACTITSGLTLWITTSRLIALQTHVADNYISSVRDPEIRAGLTYVPMVLKRVYLAGGYSQQYDAMIGICGLGLIGIFVGVYLRQTIEGNGCAAKPVVGEIQSFQFFQREPDCGFQLYS